MSEAEAGEAARMLLEHPQVWAARPQDPFGNGNWTVSVETFTGWVFALRYGYEVAETLARPQLGPAKWSPIHTR